MRQSIAPEVDFGIAALVTSAGHRIVRGQDRHNHMRDISVISSRSCFLAKMLGTQTRLSVPILTNRRNSRLYYINLINCRSEWIENRIWIRLGEISRSGALEG